MLTAMIDYQELPKTAHAHTGKVISHRLFPAAWRPLRRQLHHVATTRRHHRHEDLVEHMMPTARRGDTQG